MKTALFTGTFNPFTIGHADIVERALKLFDKVVIGIGYNPDKGSKEGFLSPEIEARVETIRKVYENDSRVIVEAYSDLTVDLAARHNAVAIVKGVRSVKDYEYERDQADFNKLLSDGLDTILFYSRPELSALSSSVVRTLEMFGKDVSKFVASPSDKNSK
ncbi:MAG: pantetheine-phosphate adenylyltransferase [Prevotellaceae bacterium]|nr:pantetheine-phosphate adenylyltransferase [Prevotellaceae bacterium]MDO4992889.1 pantetheine-phosphate adenylyltransferase [Prevotellaceae bacterium]